MLDNEWLTDHKQQMAIDALCVTTLSVVLIAEGRASGQAVFSKCGVDPYAQCFQFLIYTLIPVFISRVGLLIAYLRAQDRNRIQMRIEEAYFMLQVFWTASYGYWTLFNFFSLARGTLNCVARGGFSQIKLAY